MKQEIEDLIYDEARLLDEGRFDQWLSLYSAHAHYWVPIDEASDPLKDSSIIFDNHERLAMRVHQLMHESRVAQSPPSHMLRQLSSPRVKIADGHAPQAAAEWSQILMESRGGDWRQSGVGELRLYPARCSASFCREDGSWRFSSKKIVLLNRHLPLEGLSFII
ncbi:aromatic-ring-hydroxylating dioxygenase subunit beta [Pigmentiphaga sp. CHJ604]|uniref:aromatic-ring-hydroxylating dioxygenase subunit beta n=1 Tax=Pigmentiphaga sp. CHJ604 TaxID=3081984 RepID=UPI0030D32844